MKDFLKKADNLFLGELQRKIVYAHSDVLAKVLDQCLKRPATVADASRIKMAEQPGKQMGFFVLFDGVVVGVIQGRFDVDLQNATQKYVCEFTPAADYKG